MTVFGVICCAFHMCREVVVVCLGDRGLFVLTAVQIQGVSVAKQ